MSGHLPLRFALQGRMFVDVRHALGAATFAGLVATGMTMTGADAVPKQIEIDGVTIVSLESADYMPDPGGLNHPNPDIEN
jgi:hypothetical protein